MNNTPDHSDGRHAPITERFDEESAHDGPMITYKDAGAETHRELPCPLCREQFFFSQELLSLMQKILTFHFVAEKSVVDGWTDYSGMSGRSDYFAMECIADVAREMKSAPGMYGLHFGVLRVLRASIHIALAAGVLTTEERALATHLLTGLNRFGAHLCDDHCDGKKPRIDAHALELLTKPDYIGEIDLEWAWKLESYFAGKSIEEIAKLLRQQLKDRVEDCRANIATAHDNKPANVSVTLDEANQALVAIERNAETWHEQIREAEHLVELFSLSDKVHDQVTKLDVWVGTDCAGAQDTSYPARIYLAIERIPDLVDWDACENLKQLRASVRAAHSATGTDNGEKQTVLVGAGNNE